VPASAARVVEEIAARAAKEARTGDRVGEVAFGREPVVEHAPVEGFVRTPEVRTLDRDGSDLARAIDAGLALIPPDRPGSLLLLSDGEATGGRPSRRRRAARRDVRIDVVPLRRAGTFDLSVEELSLPSEVAAGEPFQLSAWVRSDRPVSGTWRLERDGIVVAEGRRAFRAGLERIGVRDRIGTPGVHEVRLHVTLDARPFPRTTWPAPRCGWTPPRASSPSPRAGARTASRGASSPPGWRSTSPGPPTRRSPSTPSTAIAP
jgi:hypothetical protein